MSDEAGRMPSPGKVQIVVTDTIEYEIEIDTADPRWAGLAEISSNPDEWIAMLDEEANQPDSDLAVLVKQMRPTEAYREVTHV